MRIRNNCGFNVSVNAKHTGTGSAPKRVTIPAGATLELTDAEWKADFADNEAVKSSLKSGALEITKAVVLTEAETEEVNAEALAAAQKLIAAHNASEADKSKEAPTKEADKTKEAPADKSKEAPTKEADKANK